jgi:hypothetical protein
MSHDNITDTYTYLRLCSAQHKRKYEKVLSIERPRGILFDGTFRLDLR